MASITEPTVTQAVRESLQPLTGAPQDYDRLLDLVGDARFALSEGVARDARFYRERAQITKRLIEEKGSSPAASH